MRFDMIGPSKPPASRATGATRSIKSVKFVAKRGVGHRLSPGLGWEPVAARQRLHDWAGYGIAQATDNLPAIDDRRPVVDRQRKARAGEHLFDRRLLLPLGIAVVAGDA